MRVYFVLLVNSLSRKKRRWQDAATCMVEGSRARDITAMRGMAASVSE